VTNVLTRCVVTIIAAIVISACGVLNPTDTEGTLEAANADLETRSVDVIVTAQANRTYVQMTAAAGETRIAEESNINNQVLATVSAGSTPTLSIVPGDAGPGSGAASGDVDSMDDMASVGGEQSFLVTGTSATVNDADGCITNPTTAFSTSTSRIYATVRGLNMTAGTQMTAQWTFGGQPVWNDSWTVDADYADLCIWFYLIPDYVPFSPGSWSVQLFANGSAIGTPMAFTIQ
jgi:hypothetical protein